VHGSDIAVTNVTSSSAIAERLIAERLNGGSLIVKGGRLELERQYLWTL